MTRKTNHLKKKRKKLADFCFVYIWQKKNRSMISRVPMIDNIDCTMMERISLNELY